MAADVELAGPGRSPDRGGGEERGGEEEEEEQLRERRPRSGHGEFDSPSRFGAVSSRCGGGRGGGLWRLVASSRWMMVLDGAGGRADGDTFTEPPGRFVADAGRAGRPRLRAGF